MLHSITCQHVKVKPRNPATPEPQEAKQEEAAAKHEAKAPAVFGEVKGANGGSSSASPTYSRNRTIEGYRGLSRLSVGR